MKKTRSDEDLVSDYAKAAAYHHHLSIDGPIAKANRQFGRVIKAYAKIKERGLEVQRKLLPFLHDPDVGVRLWSGIFALEFAPSEAEATLNAMTSLGGFTGATAALTLWQWKRGGMRFTGPGEKPR